MIASKRLYLTTDKSTVVDATHPDAKFLFAGVGQEIHPHDVKRYGLDQPDAGEEKDFEGDFEEDYRLAEQSAVGARGGIAAVLAEIGMQPEPAQAAPKHALVEGELAFPPTGTGNRIVFDMWSMPVASLRENLAERGCSIDQAASKAQVIDALLAAAGYKFDSAGVSTVSKNGESAVEKGAKPDDSGPDASKHPGAKRIMLPADKAIKGPPQDK